MRSRFGLSIDNIIAADVVTADGRLVRASGTENSDLLWALRGGGGNFGIVTSFEFALHPVGPRLMFCAPLYPLSAGSALIRFWRDFLADKSADVASIVEFSTIPRDPDYPERFWASGSIRSPRSTRGMPTRATGCCGRCVSSVSWSPTSRAR